MNTIIKDLEATVKENIDDIIENYDEQIEKLNVKIAELEEEINDVNDCEEYTTALGTIHVHNQTGNLKLQEEMDDFFEKLIRKYN